MTTGTNKAIPGETREGSASSSKRQSKTDMVATVSNKPRRISANQIKLYSDIVLFVAYVIVNIPQATGITFHEWISVVFIVPLVIHILLDWKWVVSVTKRMFGKLPGEVRFNHIFDLLIFIMMTLALMTGFIISEAALPALGIHVVIDPFWSSMHDLSANLTMLLIGIHLAMHWGWITSSFKRYFGSARKAATPSQGAD